MGGIIVGFLLIGVLQATPDDKKVVLLSTEWLPYTGSQLPNHGVASEVVTEAFKLTGYSVEILYMPWARLIEEVRVGNYDGTVAAYWSDERASEFLYSTAYLHSPLVFYKLAQANIQWERLEDLTPYRIGVVRGYVNTPEFDKADYLDKEVVNNDLFNLMKLVAGHIDLAVVDGITAQRIISTELAEFSGNIEPIEPVLVAHPLYVMFSKHAPGADEKMAAFNQGLARLVNAGRLKDIREKHGIE